MKKMEIFGFGMFLIALGLIIKFFSIKQIESILIVIGIMIMILSIIMKGGQNGTRKFKTKVIK